MNKAFGNAIVTALIALVTSLITLFSQDGVQTFVEISQVSYATAVLGSLSAGLVAYKARQAEPE